jgi:hypothetical protein
LFRNGEDLPEDEEEVRSHIRFQYFESLSVISPRHRQAESFCEAGKFENGSALNPALNSRIAQLLVLTYAT